MRKIIIAAIVLVLIGVFVMRQSNFRNDQNVAVAPTSTVSEAQIPEGWQKYENTDLAITFAVPSDYNIEKNGDYSVLATPPADKNYLVGNARFFYVSVVLDSLKGDETAQVYNYSSSLHKKLMDIPVGQIRNLSINEGQKDYYMYERQGDETFGGRTAKVYVNQRPWEFPNGTWEYRYVFELPQKTVIAGAYIDGGPSDAPFALPELTRIMNTLLIK